MRGRKEGEKMRTRKVRAEKRVENASSRLSLATTKL
jgi:hypothetical protein